MRRWSHRSRSFRKLAVEAVESRVLLHGGSLVVDNPVDESDGDFSQGDLSLREAIQIANDTPGTDTIDFDMAFLSGSDLELTMEAAHGNALVILDSVIINGPGADVLAVDASPLDPNVNVADGSGSRIFQMAAGANIEISGLTLTGGDASGDGGAISNYAQLVLRDVTITGNAAWRGGAVWNRATVTIEDSQISGNTARFAGGGVYSERATMIVNDSLLFSNAAAVAGGAIGNGGGSLALNDSLVTGNVSLRGGGIEHAGKVIYDYYYNPYTYQGYFYYTVYTAEFTMNRSTVDNNAAYDGGGVSIGQGTYSYINDSTISANSAFDEGGGLYLYRENTYPFSSVGTTAQIANSTITGNNAVNQGGGIMESSSSFAYGSLAIRYSTITNNESSVNGGGGLSAPYGGAVYLHGSIVAENSNSLGTAKQDLRENGNLILTYSLVGNARGTSLTEAPVGSPDVNGNLIGGPDLGIIDPGLAPLADNGGPTRTHALFAFSPAVDSAADVGMAPTSDQRGRPRLLGTEIDMGAVESNGLDGDFDDSTVYDCADVDDLVANIAAGAANPAIYDLNADGLVNLVDLSHWLAEAVAVNLPSGNPFLAGDANLDGTVDGMDFLVWNANKFTSTAAWCLGDFNADGFTDGNDFLIWNRSKFQSSALRIPAKVETTAAVRHLPPVEQLASREDPVDLHRIKAATNLIGYRIVIHDTQHAVDHVMAEISHVSPTASLHAGPAGINSASVACQSEATSMQVAASA